MQVSVLFYLSLLFLPVGKVYFDELSSFFLPYNNLNYQNQSSEC